MSRWRSPNLLAINTIAALSLSGCKTHPPSDPRIEPPLVRLAAVQTASGSERAFTGIIAARVQSNLGFRVPGKVIKRLVDTGQLVRLGQPLMRIDRTDYAHAIEAQTEIVAAAKARADQTASDEARYRGLVATGAVSASTYDQIKAAADAARGQLAAAEAQARITKDEGEYTTLFADGEGVVAETLAEPGQVVAAGQTVLKLAHSGPREASVNLPETMPRPTVGSGAQATLYGISSKRYPAHLRQLSDAADPLTRTFEARYVLGGNAARAPLGATVTVYLNAHQSEPFLEVPLGAIFDPGSGPGVWILDPQTSLVSFRKVRIHQLGEELATLSGGVAPGERVVALGAHLLHEGERVRIEDGKAAAR